MKRQPTVMEQLAAKVAATPDGAKFIASLRKDENGNFINPPSPHGALSAMLSTRRDDILPQGGREIGLR